MKIIVFGSTGSIGKHVVNQAIKEGHTVTAFTRNRSRVGLRDDKLTIVEGDVLIADDVDAVVPGHDAVICVLGAGRKGGVRSKGTENIINAMKKSGVTRLICQSSMGVGDSHNVLNFFWKYIMFGLLLRPAFADHVQQEELVRNSQLDWTIVRPASFTDGKLTGRYQHGAFSSGKSLALKISRADVASFLLKQLVDSSYMNKSPCLSY